MGTKHTRQAKIEWFERVFSVAKAKDKVLDRQLLLAMFALENLSTKQTGMQILDIFDKTGRIKVGSDAVVVIK